MIPIFEKVRAKSKADLLAYAKGLIDVDDLASRRSRFDLNNLYSTNRIPEKSGHKKPCADETFYNDDNIVVPIIGPQLDSITAQLVKLFLSDDPIFQVITTPAKADIAAQFNSLFHLYSRRFQWVSNLTLAIQDLARYNLTFVETSWVDYRVVSGVKIERHSPYNVIFDSSLPVRHLITEGLYCGVLMQKTGVALRQYANMNGLVLSPEAISSKPAGKLRYELPNMQFSRSNAGLEVFLPEKQSSKFHELVKLYVRIIPADFGLSVREGTDSTLPAIYCLHILNDKYLVGIHEVSSAYPYFPLLGCQIRNSDYEISGETFAEQLVPIQNLATKLYAGDINSLRRILTDRALYDPRMYAEEMIASPNPAEKIPLKPGVPIGTPLSAGYQPISYNDPALGVRISQANQLSSFANYITGLNPAQQGQFVRGNKSRAEFVEIMGNADARLITMAYSLSDDLFNFIKELLLSDILINVNELEIPDYRTGQMITVSSAILRQTPVSWRMSGGLATSKMQIPIEGITQFVQVLMQSPLGAARINFEKLANFIAESYGFTDFAEVLNSDEAVNAMLSAANAQRDSASGNTEGNSGTGQS